MVFLVFNRLNNLAFGRIERFGRTKCSLRGNGPNFKYKNSHQTSKVEEDYLKMEPEYMAKPRLRSRRCWASVNRAIYCEISITEYETIEILEINKHDD